MAQMLLLNPRRRASTKRRATSAKRKPTRRKPTRNPAPKTRRRISTKARRVSTRRRYRRNPIKKFGNISTQVMDAFIAAGGAIGLDIVMGYVPLPAALNSGVARHATKAFGAILMGIAGDAFLPKNISGKMANGALTVVLHDAMKEQISTMAPGLTLGAAAIPYYPSMPEPDSLGYYNPAQTDDYGMGEYVPDGMGEYIEY